MCFDRSLLLSPKTSLQHSQVRRIIVSLPRYHKSCRDTLIRTTCTTPELRRITIMSTQWQVIS